MANIPRGALFAAVLTVAVSVFASAPSHAQNFPNRPIHLIIGFPAGGGSDVPGRIVANKLAEVLGQPVVAENRTGAGGFIGAEMVARAAPDGYTIYGCSISTHGTGPALYKTPPPVDPEKDFSFVGMIGWNANVLMVHPSVPVKTVAEFVAWAKAEPKKSYAVAGVGGSPQLAMELFKQMAGFDVVSVPYRGDAPARLDVVGGHVPAMFGGLGPQLPAIRAGQARPIAVTSSERDPSLPDVPTLAESGYPGFRIISWLGLCAPAKTPQPVLDTLNAALVKVLNDPATRAQLLQNTVNPQPMSGAEFASYVSSELEKYRKLVKAAGLSLELEK